MAGIVVIRGGGAVDFDDIDDAAASAAAVLLLVGDAGRWWTGEVFVVEFVCAVARREVGGVAREFEARGVVVVSAGESFGGNVARDTGCVLFGEALARHACAEEWEAAAFAVAEDESGDEGDSEDQGEDADDCAYESGSAEALGRGKGCGWFEGGTDAGGVWVEGRVEDLEDTIADKVVRCSDAGGICVEATVGLADEYCTSVLEGWMSCVIFEFTGVEWRYTLDDGIAKDGIELVFCERVETCEPWAKLWTIWTEDGQVRKIIHDADGR